MESGLWNSKDSCSYPGFSPFCLGQVDHSNLQFSNVPNGDNVTPNMTVFGHRAFKEVM